MMHSLADILIPGIMLFAIFQGTILIIVLLKLRKGNQLGHGILACLIFFFVFHLMSDLFNEFEYFVDESILGYLFDILLFSVGLTVAPLIYLYTDVITRKTVNVLNKLFWLHFLPATLFLLAAIPLLLINDKLIYANEDIELSSFGLLTLFIQLFFLVQIFIYLICSFLKLHQHNKTIKIFFSATERINLQWLRNILIGFTIFYFIVWIHLFSDIFSLEKQFESILTLSMVALVYLLGYMGMQQADIFGKEIQAFTKDFTIIPPLISKEHVLISQNKSKFNNAAKFTTDIETKVDALDNQSTDSELEEVEIVEKGATTIEIKDKLYKEKTENAATASQAKQKWTDLSEQKKGKYQKSALDKETSKLLFDELLIFMEKNKPFLENDISLSGLAKQVSLSPNYLSQIINEQSQNNFFDFINRYRVNHVKNLLSEQLTSKQKVNMIDTALAAGFNSKSAFYSAFKKYEGMTPSQYKKSIS